MSKKTILLADNSYTIRRIVELSFSEVEGIELISFENSLNLKEQLLELKPAVVLVDIKFPEFNGYEVCKFINEEETLKSTKVFLLKGGFEPVDENLLKGLSYIDIITKPFDSNALVTSIEKLIKDPSSVEAGESPPPIPEELPEVKDGPAGTDISFSDIKDEIESDEIKIDQTDKEPGVYPGEEVMPSEEITQGTQTEKQDSLSPEAPNSEDLDNPFKDEPGEVPEDKEDLDEEEYNIKMNIQQQEKELDLNSLTSDEIEIKKQIGLSKDLVQDKGEGPKEGSNLDEPPKEDEESELPEVGDFGMDEVKEIPEEKVEGIAEIPDLDTSEIEKEIGLEDEVKEEPLSSDLDEPAEQKPTMPEEQLVTYFDEEKKGESEDSPPPEGVEEGIDKLELMDEPPAEKELSLDEIGGEAVEEAPVAEEKEESGLELAPEKPPAETPLTLDEIGAEPEGEAPLQEAKVEEDLKLEMDEPLAEKEESLEDAAPEDKIEMVAEETTAEELKPEIDEFKEKIAETGEAISKEELQDKIEDKLSKSIQELLWEIVPPMAEKIIKEEIEKIKLEVTKAFD
jgi:DNA-binding response OmpR family regulator